jgi:hypothetical protein
MAATKADKIAAQKLLTQGNQLMGEGDYVAALEKFKAAYERYPSPKILLNIGTTLRQLGRNVEAAEVYELYLQDPETDASRKPEVERILREIDAVVGRIRIRVDKPATDVRLDGKQLEEFENGMVIRVEPGEHTIVATREGFPPAVKTLKVQPRDELLVELRFEAPKPKIITAPPPPPSTQGTIGLVVGGIGVAGIGMGSVFGLLALVNNNRAASRCLQGVVCDQEGFDLSGTAETQATISTVSFIAGIAVLAGGAVLLITAPSKERPKGPPASALLVGGAPAPGGATLTLGGLW